MNQFISSAIGSAVKHNTSENFDNYNDHKMIVTLLTFFVFTMLIFLLGKYLWNNILVKLVPVIKKTDTVWDIYGLYILFSLLFGNR